MKDLHSSVPVPLAREFMNDHVMSFQAHNELDRAVTKLLRRGYSGAPVVDESNHLVGILSEHDCAGALARAAYEGWSVGTVGDTMTRELETLPLDTDLFATADRFRTTAARRLPVVDQNGRLVGLVTRRDLLAALDRFRHRQEQARLMDTHDLIRGRRE